MATIEMPNLNNIKNLEHANISDIVWINEKNEKFDVTLIQAPFKPVGYKELTAAVSKYNTKFIPALKIIAPHLALQRS